MAQITFMITGVTKENIDLVKKAVEPAALSAGTESVRYVTVETDDEGHVAESALQANLPQGVKATIRTTVAKTPDKKKTSKDPQVKTQEGGAPATNESATAAVPESNDKVPADQTRTPQTTDVKEASAARRPKLRKR